MPGELRTPRLLARKVVKFGENKPRTTSICVFPFANVRASLSDSFCTFFCYFGEAEAIEIVRKLLTMSPEEAGLISGTFDSRWQPKKVAQVKRTWVTLQDFIHLLACLDATRPATSGHSSSAARV